MLILIKKLKNKEHFRHKDILYAILIFVLIAVFSYLTKNYFYDYYLVRQVDNTSGAILSQVFATSALWILGLAFSVLFYLLVRSRIRIAPLILWALLFFVNVFFWFVNLKFVRFTGVEVNPLFTTQIKGSSHMLINAIKDFSTFIWLAYLVLIFTFLYQMFKNIKRTLLGIMFFCFIFFLAGLSLFLFNFSFKSLQEYIVPHNYFVYYTKDSPGTVFSRKKSKDDDSLAEDNLGFLEKLKSFGFSYDVDEAAISYHRRIYDSSSPALLPAKIKSKPNILIVFLESFSNDITSIHNQKLPGLTPNLEKMANHDNTTLFNHYYSASTPTVLGLISQLCSFLPPTGHEEMKQDGTLVYHQLMCLPDVLRNNGYNDAFYLHAVEKSFSNKDKILQSAGVDDERIYGKDEIFSFIKTRNLEDSVGLEPLSWGYSDHQLYPVFWELMQEVKEEPFLGMMTTIDTHIPYTSSKDIIEYPGSKTNDAFNAFYTADHAFGQFWDKFINSDLRDTTILVVVADHAVFPAVYADKQDLFDDAGNKASFDETLFMMYIPDSILPKSVETFSSSIDFAPTLLHVLGINLPNFFEGHSIFYDRYLYPNLLGANEFQLYINQLASTGERDISFDSPRFIKDYESEDLASDTFTLSDYLQYYEWKRRMLKEGRFWKIDCVDASCFNLDKPQLIAHAGGGILGLTYTNSKEALERNYSEGFRYFEMDFSWTLDDELVLIHDFKQTYKNLFGREDGVPYGLFFKNIKMKHELTQMNIEDLFYWIDNHQDARIVTDVKERNIEAMQYIAQADYSDYFIVQVYNEKEIKIAEDLGYENIILTLYQANYDNDRVLDIAGKYDLFAITMNQERAGREGLAKKLNEKGVMVYLHTINDLEKLTDLRALGAGGFYTDFITPRDIASIK
ncbi:sulfatase-like hydrolase/transferase [Candidatus Falkowbacteria bacterium]|nr:sulfatase-like hydrolase/transferase [Candidatus Falkowbacteria bacterium]